MQFICNSQISQLRSFYLAGNQGKTFPRFALVTVAQQKQSSWYHQIMSFIMQRTPANEILPRVILRQRNSRYPLHFHPTFNKPLFPILV